MMITFDDILPQLTKTLDPYRTELAQITPILINRDLNGRVRLIIDEKYEDNDAHKTIITKITVALETALTPHTFPADHAVLFEPNMDAVLASAGRFTLDGFENIWVVDRLLTDSNWATVSEETTGAARIVFFSIKGGVGRSTAMAVVAHQLAERGLRVLVCDIDLESPGLSSALLPADRRPKYGITDWLVEDLVDNGDMVVDAMIGISTLSHNGEIYVVPAHGVDPGDYIAKLGRVFMPKISASGTRQSWSVRLRRLLETLESRLSPHVILIDSRAGIDEVACACVADLSPSLVLLFAIDGDQTWTGYKILFRHWLLRGVAQDIRERLQIVGAMVPELGQPEYFGNLRGRAWNVFLEHLYDEIQGDTTSVNPTLFSFDEVDEAAPHYPWLVYWNPGFAALPNLSTKLSGVATDEVNSVFGSLLGGILRSLPNITEPQEDLS